MSDDVMVRPVRTYLEGSDLVSPETAPYPVSRARAEELRGNGLVTIEEPEAAPEPVEPAPEPPAEPAAPTPSGRRRRAP
ncbi:MAG: hypothetical protein WAP03_12845 [Methylorubrum rhodinum]|uniref:hypothetical protein n=1 Tax=Methylorubrum rhodinum TaxID=29428 RepID=UPI003BAED130